MLSLLEVRPYVEDDLLRYCQAGWRGPGDRGARPERTWRRAPRNRGKVIAAARSLDYPKRLPEVHRGILRIEVILVRPETTFFRRLSRAFERINATLDPSIRIHRTFMDEADPGAIAARIASTEPRKAGLILAVPDHPRPAGGRERRGRRPAGRPHHHARCGGCRRSRQHRQLRRRSYRRALPVADAEPERHGHGALSPDLPSSPRTNARLLGLSRRRAAEGLAFRWIGFGRDEARRCGDLLFQALEHWPDLVGLYNVGAGNAALADVLRQHARGRQVFFVGHELTERTAAALREGVMSVVLDQAPEAQARRATDLILKRIGLLEMETRPDAHSLHHSDGREPLI